MVIRPVPSEAHGEIDCIALKYRKIAIVAKDELLLQFQTGNRISDPMSGKLDFSQKSIGIDTLRSQHFL